MKKRLFSLLMAGVMIFALTGYQFASKAPTVAKYGKKTIKIAVELYDPSATQTIQYQNYLKYLQTYVNVDFIYSEKINSAEDEMAFIESSASAGAKVLVGFYNVSGKAAVQKAIDLGMYYYGQADDKSIYSAFKNNKLYLGGVDAGNANYKSGYNMTKGLIDAGCKNLILSSGGASFGVPIFAERVRGAKAAIDDANKKGKNIKIVKEVPGFPDETFFSAQAEALAMDVDGVIATFGGAEFWFQPIETAGKKNKVKVSTTASIDNVYKAAFESGRMATLSAELVENFAIVVPMIVNAIEGNGAVCRNSDGTAANIPGDDIYINSKDVFLKYYKVESTGIWSYGGTDILKLIKGYNNKVTYNDYKKLVAANSIDQIFKRRGIK